MLAVDIQETQPLLSSTPTVGKLSFWCQISAKMTAVRAPVRGTRAAVKRIKKSHHICLSTSTSGERIETNA